jgi:hypothetical protein
MIVIAIIGILATITMINNSQTGCSATAHHTAPDKQLSTALANGSITP